MTIVKYILWFILLVINITCGNMNNQNFKIFGQEEVLKNSKINIVEMQESDKEVIKTLLFYGEKKEIKAETEVGVIYEIYVSYKDSLVNVLRFENIMRNANDHINYLYLNKENEIISIHYVGRKSDIENQQGPSIILMEKKNFFKSKNIIKEEDVKKYDSLFFDKY